MAAALTDAERSGRRNLVGERDLLSEFGRMMHVLKAADTEKTRVAKAERRMRKSPTANRTDRKKKGSKKSNRSAARRRGKCRFSRDGGSIWMVLKGGFDAHQVPVAGTPAANPTSGAATLPEYRAEKRLQWKLKQRQKALGIAEGYMDSAWREAEAGGLLETKCKKRTLTQISSSCSPRCPSYYEGVPTDDGVTYLQEQYQAALQMISGPFVGSMLHTLVQGTCNLSANSTSTNKNANIDGNPSISDAPSAVIQKHLNEFEPQWKDLLEREAAIRNGLNEEKENKSVTERVHDEILRSWMCIAEPLASTSSHNNEVAPTKCIIRLRNSQHKKHSAVLNSVKAVHSFTSNILKVLRKELGNNSVLPRTGREDWGSTAAVSSGGNSNAPKHKQRSNNTNNATTNSKKRGGKKKR